MGEKGFTREKTLWIASWILVILLAAWPGNAQVAGDRSKEEAISQANQLIERGQPRQAIDLLQDYAEEPPTDVRVPVTLAKAYYRLADPKAKIQESFPLYRKTIEWADRALAMDPQRPEALYWHALAKLKEAQYEYETGGLLSGIIGGAEAYFITRGAIEELKEVQERRPEYEKAGAFRTLGFLYHRAPGWSPFGDVEKSIDYLREAVRIAPDYPLNRLYLARAFKSAGKEEAAAEQLRTVLEMSEKTGDGSYRDEARDMLREMESR